jgi:Ca2+-binding RTX toxin-like protein
MGSRFLRLTLATTLLAMPLGSAVPTAVGMPKGCGGRRATIVGTAGHDRLRGTEGADVISGGGGPDVVLARAGDDLICGGEGSDRVRGGAGADRILGQDGADTLDGDDGDDAILGGRGGDVCFQGWGSGRSEGCAPVVAAAGDIACAPDDPDFKGTAGAGGRCRMRATSDLLLRANLAAVLALGDLQYEDGELEDFQASYHPTWGRVKGITHPAPGNHEYRTEGASGYFTYWGTAAGDPGGGYYSFDVGRWHLIALNTYEACEGSPEGCGSESPQQRWLATDLADDHARCTLAYWHQPLFSSQPKQDQEVVGFWDALMDDRAEVVLNGHSHVYERFSPQTPRGRRSPHGIRQFIVGTGGKSLDRFDTGPAPNSVVRQDHAFGVLELALSQKGYAWRFVSEEGAAVPFSDRGSGRCH